MVHTSVPKGRDPTSGKAIPVFSSPRPHLPGDSFLEAATDVGTAAAMSELVGAVGRVPGGPRAACAFLPDGGLPGAEPGSLCLPRSTSVSLFVLLSLFYTYVSLSLVLVISLPLSVVLPPCLLSPRSELRSCPNFPSVQQRLWLWEISPRAAYDPLNLYCLHRGSTGHTCSATKVPPEPVSPAGSTHAPLLPGVPGSLLNSVFKLSAIQCQISKRGVDSIHFSQDLTLFELIGMLLGTVRVAEACAPVCGSAHAVLAVGPG